MKKYYFALLGIFFLNVINGQNKADYKFGKITAENFNLASDKLDSGANALIILDIGSTQFDGNHKGFFTLIFTRFLRVKILNKNGSDIGNREIPLYHKVNVYQEENELHSENDAEKVTALKASTFNLENGVVTETKLDEKSVYVEKYNKEYDIYKFSLPALKEGSIFDLEYTVTSPNYDRMQPWKFQSEYPCLWSEYHVTIPPCFHYEMRLRGNSHFERAIYLSPDSIKESSVTSVIIINDEKGKFSGAYKSTKGENESFDLRREIQYSSINNFEKEMKTVSESEIAIENFGIDSLNSYDFPLSVHYDFELKNFSTDDIIYFNPMLNKGYKTNPFKSMERLYPVEMPYKLEETYVLNMDIPTGYQLDEMPKSVRVAYNENEGMFEYLIQRGQNNLQMRVHLKLDKAFFPVDEYSTLRDFFAYVVKKENEQIVFKKTH